MAFTTLAVTVQPGALVQKVGVAGCISWDGTGGACQNGTALDGVRSVVVSGDGKNVYAPSFNSGAVVVFDRDTLTGELTQKVGTAGCISDTGNVGACQTGTALNGADLVVVSGDGKNVYVASFSSGAVVVFDRDTVTGELTQKVGVAGCISDIGDVGACRNGRALAGASSVVVSGDGKNVYAGSWISGAVVVFDRDTGSRKRCCVAGSKRLARQDSSAGGVWSRYQRAQKRLSNGVGRTFKRNMSGHGSLLRGLIGPFQLKDLAAWKRK